MSRRNIVVAWVVVVSWWCVGAVWGEQGPAMSRVTSTSLDLNHPIDDPVVMSRLEVSGGGGGVPVVRRERESDFEREKRRKMEIAREREQERNSHEGKGQIYVRDESALRGQGGDMESKRERDREEEIAREINKATARRKAILREKAFSSARSSENSDRTEVSLQRQIDRALRGGDALEKSVNKLVRDTLREGVRGDNSHTQVQTEHRHHRKETTRRKPPILIIEQVPVPYPMSVNPSLYAETHSQEASGEGHSDPKLWFQGAPQPGDGHHFQDSSPGKPFVDRRAPDSPVALPRPDIAFTDRRPDRPDFPYKYDEIHIAAPGDPGDSLEHLTEPVDAALIDHTLPLPAAGHLPHDQGFPETGAVRNPSLSLHAPHVLPHHVPHADVALQQAIIAEQALHAQAVQAGKIKQAALAAHLAGQVAAQQVAAHKVAAQLVAAGRASARHKAAQLSRIMAGNAAIKVAIKNKLEHDSGHRLKKLLSHKPAEAGVNVLVGDAAVTDPLAPSDLQEHHPFLARRVDQLREELIHRLTLLKPYFEGSSSGFAVPSVIPELPAGTHLTPLQVEALPRITLQVPDEAVQSTPLHISDLQGELSPPISPEYVEYLMGLPDDLFVLVTNLSKPQFLMALFPRLYRKSVHHFSPFTTTDVLAHTPVYLPAATTPHTPYASTDHHYPNPRGPLVVSPPSHTTIGLSVTPAPSPYKITLNKLFRGGPAVGFPATGETGTSPSVPLAPLHVSTTLPPPSPSSLGYGAPKPTSIIELSDVCAKCGGKDDHHHHHHHHKQDKHQGHPHSSHHNHSGGQKHVHHHHVHHHLHSVQSSSPATSLSVTVKTPSYSIVHGAKEASEHKTHFSSPKPVHHTKGQSAIRSDRDFLASTTPAPSLVTGVGLRPHGSHHQFITPITPAPASPFSVTPLPPTTTPAVPLTSSYTSYLPSTSHGSSYASLAPTHSSFGASSPLPTNIPHESPFLPFIPITTTTGPRILPSHTPFQATPRPLVPATSPVFAVTKIPATTDSSTIFRLRPSFPLNGQFFPVISGASSLNEPHSQDTREESDANTSTSTTSLERLRLASDEGSDLDRIPGTDSADDDHILSPFHKRKGNATGDTRQNTEASSTSTTPSPAISEVPKKHPMPQRVGVEGLPLTAASPTHLPHQHPLASLALQVGNMHQAVNRRPLAGEGLKLPPYLKEAPPCANAPVNKSFCLMPQGYPSELAGNLVKVFRKELTQAQEVLLQVIESQPQPPASPQALGNTALNASVECENEEKTVDLSWSRDILGNWFVILQTEPFTQPTRVTTCSAASRLEGCRPLLRPRPLLALQPRDPEPFPVILEFPLPVACVYPARLNALATFAAMTHADPPPPPPDTMDFMDSMDFQPDHGDTTRLPPRQPRLTPSSKSSVFTTRHHLPSPTHAIQSASITSQVFPRPSLSLRPFTSPEELGEDVLAGVIISHNGMTDRIRVKSGCVPPVLTHAVITSSVIISLLVQRHSCSDLLKR